MIDETDSTFPVTVMPSQYYERETVTEPWHRLMLAVLIDGIRCFQNNLESTTAEGRRDFREAQEWLFSNADSGPFAYHAVCHVLGIDGSYLRDRLRRWFIAHVRHTAGGSRRADASRRILRAHAHSRSDLGTIEVRH